MQITTTVLTRGAAVAAATAGAIFVAVQVGHPASDAFTTETSAWVARSTAKTVMAALALAGIAGLYLRQHRQAGVLGLVGYVVFTVGYLGMFVSEVVAATVLPALVDSRPGFVDDVIAAAVGGAPAGDIGGVQTLLNVAGLGYILGGLLFGVAIFRARVLPRWMGVLLAVSTVATAALAVLPESFNRPMAVPEGIALVALGIALWRNPTDSVPAPATPALITLSLIPVTAGTLRLVQLAGGPSPMPVDDRFAGVPVALVAHIVGAATYAVLGAFQLVPAIRRQHPGWHRRTGRVLVVAGLAVVGSALWITLTYAPQPGTGVVLYAARLVVAPAMGVALVLGFAAIRRRDVTAHQAWMIRAYALGLGAGTQAFTDGLGTALVGTGEIRNDLAKTAGWLINLAVAEWAIRRGRAR